MSSSARKIASARANGAKTRGRATEAGKQISSLNAATHELTAQTVALAFKALSESNARFRCSTAIRLATTASTSAS